MNGKETVTRTEIKKGKNIGKKNETTPLEQAHLETKSLVKKQMDAGYVDNLGDLERRILILPMLANKWDTMSKYISEPYWVQPKLDGVRMLIGRYQGKLLVLSRTGKAVQHMDHITNEMQWIEEGFFLDGESYNHDISFEEITGLCRTSLETSASEKQMNSIQFHVFDTFHLDHMDRTFVQRWEILQNIFKMHSFEYTKLVSTTLVDYKLDVPKWHSEFVKSGYEGLMIRDSNGKYILSDRSNFLLKYKSFETHEYKIVGAEEAKGRDIGTVVWVCQTAKGNTFSVRPKGTQEDRTKWLKNKDKYINKMLTVQYQNLTPDGVPRFPVGLTIRDYE